MGLQALRAGLSARLATISGLVAHDSLPTTVRPPCVVVTITGGDYDMTMADGGALMRFEVVLIGSQVATPYDVAYDAVDAYLAPTGALSVKAAVEADVTLGGTAHTSRVTGFSDYGTMVIAGIEYLGARMTVEAWPV